MPDSSYPAQLAELLVETGQRHHQAFAETDGADPEWPMWYADYLYGRIDQYVDTQPTKSEIIQCLVSASEAHEATDVDEGWPSFYANYILSVCSMGTSSERVPT
ncbi:MAG: hypothetical protein ACR2N7_10235 [Acidimicrobiia bacterium]